MLHINLTSIVHNLIWKVNKHVALRLQLDSMAVSFYFGNFANGSEHKGLSAFTGKFPSSAAGLHLVLKTIYLRKKSRLVCYHMVECFHVITIDAKRLYCRCEQYCIILCSRNKSFSQNPFEFLHIRESLVSRSSRLETRYSRLDPRTFRASRLEVRVSSVNLLLSGTVDTTLGMKNNARNG